MPANLNIMSETYEKLITPRADTPPLRSISPQQTATAGDGAHPTGMHPCLMWKSCNETRTLSSHARFVDLLRPFVLIHKNE